MSRKAKADEKIIKFSINVEEKVLTDLKQRLENARLKTDLEEPSFNYGFRVRFFFRVNARCSSGK